MKITINNGRIEITPDQAGDVKMLRQFKEQLEAANAQFTSISVHNKLIAIDLPIQTRAK